MAVPALFASWRQRLAPGVEHASRVVAERILYRSAQDKAGWRPERDGMEVGELRMPLEEAPRRRREEDP